MPLSQLAPMGATKRKKNNQTKIKLEKGKKKRDAERERERRRVRPPVHTSPENRQRANKKNRRAATNFRSVTDRIDSTHSHTHTHTHTHAFVDGFLRTLLFVSCCRITNLMALQGFTGFYLALLGFT